MDHIEQNRLTPIYDNEYDRQLQGFHEKARELYDELFMQTVEDIELRTAQPFNPKDNAQAQTFVLMLRDAFTSDIRIRQEMAAPHGGEWLGFSGKGLYQMYKNGLPVDEPAIFNQKFRVGGEHVGFVVMSYIDEAFLDAQLPLKASGQHLRVSEYVRPFGIHYAMKDPFVQRIQDPDEPRSLPADMLYVPIHYGHLTINRLA